MILHSRKGGRNKQSVRIHPAVAADAEVIYALMLQCFGPRYLSYSIYQAAESVTHIRELIERGPTISRHHFFVAATAKEVTGYYNAVLQADHFFLNYIAVAPSRRRIGLGGTLLRHFEATGSCIGCRTLMLDVFESNEEAVAWYYGQGYQPQLTTFRARLRLSQCGFVNSLPTCEASMWYAAWAEERTRGFSKVECTIGSETMCVGLIGGHTCTLLSHSGMQIEEALAGIAALFGQLRETVIVAGLPSIPHSWPVIDAVKSLRLTKAISVSNEDQERVW